MGKKKPKKSKKEKGGDKVVFGKSEKEKIEKEVKELIDVAGIEFVAVIDDRGDALISAGKHEGIDQAQLLAQTSIIYGTSEKGGINLKKGAVIEINVTWKEGVSVLETLSKGYTLHVIASKEEKMAWFRPAIMATTRAIQEIIGS